MLPQCKDDPNIGGQAEQLHEVATATLHFGARHGAIPGTVPDVPRDRVPVQSEGPRHPGGRVGRPHVASRRVVIVG